jgi:hypothetical protein
MFQGNTQPLPSTSKNKFIKQLAELTEAEKAVETLARIGALNELLQAREYRL